MWPFSALILTFLLSTNQQFGPTVLINWTSDHKLDVLVLQKRCHSILTANQFSTAKNYLDGKRLCLKCRSASCFIMNTFFTIVDIWYVFLQYPFFLCYTNVICNTLERQVIYTLFHLPYIRSQYLTGNASCLHFHWSCLSHCSLA